MALVSTRLRLNAVKSLTDVPIDGAVLTFVPADVPDGDQVAGEITLTFYNPVVISAFELGKVYRVEFFREPN